MVGIPELHGAIWYQLALLMTDARPTKPCEVCGGPIFRPRRDQRTCSARCRKAKSRRNQETNTA